MKKISILVALALIVTIGGVYATWSYNQSTTNIIEEHLTANMQDYVGSSANGHIEIIEKTVDIRVTDNLKDGNTVGSGEEGDFEAELEITGHLVILFTPFDMGSSQSVNLQYEVGTTGAMNYENQAIFDVDATATECDPLTKIENTDDLNELNAMLTSEHQLTSTAIGKYYVEIDAADLAALIDLNGTFTLDTLIEYHNFQTALGQGNIKVVVSEKVA